MKNTKQLVMTGLKNYVLPSLALIGVGVGCASGKKGTMARSNGSVTEVAALPPAAPAYPPAYTPTYTPSYTAAAPASLQQPVSDAAYTTPAMASSVTRVSSGQAGGSYTVQKGDTLIKIARDRYGDATAWKRIAAANPAAQAGLIKPGQRLVLP